LYKPLEAGEPETPTVDIGLFAVGDSITTTSIDATDNKGWPLHLVDVVRTATGLNVAEQPTRIARGGCDVAEMASVIDAELGYSYRNKAATKIMVYLGANDITDSHGWPLNETTWKTNYRYILNALHTKWATTPIYIGKSYRNDAIMLTRLAILSGWIDDLVAEQAYYHAGLDGRDVFTGHPELLADEVHPNHDGCVAMGNAWKTIIGY
jgi:lysophospholipase L1-like esterase